MIGYLRDLVDEWRGQAEQMEAYGLTQTPNALRRCAVQLEASVQHHDTETLTLESAAHESGLSYSTLQKRVASGEIPNAGRKNRPRIQRKDLPFVRPDPVTETVTHLRVSGGAR
jgi:hypothetical protein